MPLILQKWLLCIVKRRGTLIVLVFGDMIIFSCDIPHALCAAPFEGGSIIVRCALFLFLVFIFLGFYILGFLYSRVFIFLGFYILGFLYSWALILAFTCKKEKQHTQIEEEESTANDN